MAVRRTLIASDLLRAAIVLALVVAPGPWHIYGLLFVMSTVSIFFVPARSVTIRTPVPNEGLVSADALFQQTMQLARIASLALAGALVGWFGPASCYLIDVATYVAPVPIEPSG